MINSRPTKKDLEKLAQQIKDDQTITKPAEKRAKIKISFQKAVRKMGQTPPPK